MPRPTQAHLTRTIERSKPSGAKELLKKQMEYYMGAKLIEVGVDPKSAVFRWSTEVKGVREVYTYSAYWGDSKRELEAE